MIFHQPLEFQPTDLAALPSSICRFRICGDGDGPEQRHRSGPGALRPCALQRRSAEDGTVLLWRTGDDWWFGDLGWEASRSKIEEIIPVVK